VSEFGRLEVLVHVRRGDEILVVRRTDHGYWHVISGGIEAGEDAAAAARRELWEETRLQADVRPIGGFEYAREPWESSPGMRCDVTAFVAEAPAGWEPQLDHEHDDYRWCSLADADALIRFPEPRELLRSLC
jgi:dATP pyrophosphohydrolase